ncbi:50S ribosomal protein L6 [Peredibacter starrii]|uniref:Large ribosomal subunit protein uL6 n=1 Tax=Peredibacter starrii TaxID=28202 RepID=A0AAX4HPU8_9BACT|nr:50S ribosomal protein L6 [Peredibacter starrii]WPU65240.1 50S ribosomal protein L6 [Peredibacter starrii]
MSRIGKKPVGIPDKVEVKVNGLTVDVKGPKGQLSYTFHKDVKIEKADKAINVLPANQTTSAKAVWGMSRTLLGNMVTGVTTGFVKSLEFNGVGYKAAVSGSTLTLNLGYSHSIDYKLPKGVEAKVNKNVIEFHGCDKELVGFVAAQVRSFREPEPYKGKGLKYTDETIIRKAGKTGAKK